MTTVYDKIEKWAIERNLIDGSTSQAQFVKLAEELGEVASVVAGMFRKEYGDSDFAYCHMGHLHHDKLQEGNLMTVEQHQTLAARDAYASRGGWLSGRSAKVITYHDKY